MEFIETPTFSKFVHDVLTDDELGRLQVLLTLKPDFGRLISGSGGLRKLRWANQYKGKRGGVRVIYYWYISESTILFLDAYKKSNQDDLSKDQIRTFKNIIKEGKDG